jgi:hypothetical protein
MPDPWGDAAYDHWVRLTRHAKNRLRLLRRRAPELTEPRVLEALGSARSLGRDVKGNRRVSIRIGEILLMVVVDEAKQVVVTIWREE